MTLPKVSVLLGSSRPGGLDVTMAGLCAQTYPDFEIVFVDNRYHRRHARVLDFVSDLNFRHDFIHVPNHRNHEAGSPFATACAGYNTGLAIATGELVIQLLDYAYCPTDWIQRHVDAHPEPRLVMAPHQYIDLPPLDDGTSVPPQPEDGEPDRTADQLLSRRNISPRPIFSFTAGAPETTLENIIRQRESFDEISIFEKPFDPSQFAGLRAYGGDPKLGMSTGAPTGLASDYFHTKNESFPLANALKANGMDERFDRGRGAGDLDFGWRLLQTGLYGWILSEATVFCLNPRAVLPNANIVVPERDPYPGRMSHWDGWAIYQETISSGRVEAKNPVPLSELRAKIWNWREMSQEREAVISRREVSDEEYFK